MLHIGGQAIRSFQFIQVGHNFTPILDHSRPSYKSILTMPWMLVSVQHVLSTRGTVCTHHAREELHHDQEIVYIVASYIKCCRQISSILGGIMLCSGDTPYDVVRMSQEQLCSLLALGELVLGADSTWVCCSPARGDQPKCKCTLQGFQ